MDRDYGILREIGRWRFCLGRHVKDLVGFEGVRACDCRLLKLREAGYIERRMVLYGFAGLYILTAKGRTLIGYGKTPEKIRLEQIHHDSAVLDAVVYFMKKYGLISSCIVSEKELHRQDGFGTRKHQPDFVFTLGKKTCAVEVELSLKSTQRLIKNIEGNYLRYDVQFWVIPASQHRVRELVVGCMERYSGLSVIALEEIQGNVRERT